MMSVPIDALVQRRLRDQLTAQPVDPRSQAQALAGVVDPEIHPSEQHQVHLAFYTEWLSTREGIEAGRLMRAAVTALMDQHMQMAKMLEDAQGGQQGKPSSQSINFKDLPDAAKAQMLAEVGIKVGPGDFAQQAVKEGQTMAVGAAR